MKDIMKSRSRAKRKKSSIKSIAKGHYYRSLPRSKNQAIEKRLMEKALLSKLDPKSKEHQRKKILRIFLTWNSKQPLQETSKFWNWVKLLSPDNLSSPERFKSMSYEFLDKLLSKKCFRESLQNWMTEVYIPNLTQSAEDDHTRAFLGFIENSIDIKEKTEKMKEAFFSPEPESNEFSGLVVKIVDTPVDPGAFLEFRCSKNNCQFSKYKHFAYLGVGLKIDCLKVCRDFKCTACGENAKIANFGVCSCKYWLKGAVDMQDLTVCYTTLDEFHFYDWNEMWLCCCTLTEEEKGELEKVVMAAFTDTAVPKKKYCKRKGLLKLPAVSDSDIARTVVELEKEIIDLNSQIYDLLMDSYKNHILIQDLSKNLNYIAGTKD